MATLTPTSASVDGYAASTVNTLTAADVIVFNSAKTQLLQFRNTTASPVVITIDGSASTAVKIPNTGKTFDAPAGLQITVAANGTGSVVLKSISAFMQGTVALTGGVGLEAVLYEF